VNLCAGANYGSCDAALHVNPRYYQNNVVVRNSFISGGWGAEERAGAPFHVPKGQQLECMILIQHNAFKVRYSTCLVRPASLAAVNDKAVIDGRPHPLVFHLGSYFKRRKSSPVRPLTCNWYYCAQFIAKSKAACALPFSGAASSSSLGWLMSKYDVIHKTGST